MNYDSKRAITEMLESRGLSMQKRFGQNFLISPGARNKILSLLGAEREDFIWEIGPGIGAMTHMLLGNIKGLAVFEIDYGFISYLRDTFGERPEFSIIEGDFLKTWKAAWQEGPKPDRVLGNLPYNCASRIIAAFIEANALPRRMVFTIQKEVAQRMTAGPGEKAYSSFSLLCQFACDIRNCGDIKPGSFYPVPEVVSTIVSLEPHDRFAGVNRKLYFTLIQSLFASRRKTIRNNLRISSLAGIYGKAELLKVFESLGIDPGRRGESLDLSTVAAIARAIAKL
jgi:16S rRNA (adenine1518-N6/adenine1519-N6)-dimethyltransferase